MTATPYMTVAGHPYAKPDELGRLPLRVFLVERHRLQAAVALRLGHPTDGLTYRYRLHFPSYEPVLRRAGKAAKAHLLSQMDLSPTERSYACPRAYYQYTYLRVDQSWRHRFRITCQLTNARTVDVPFRWNHFLVEMKTYSVVGTFEARCPDCSNRLMLQVEMYVDTGAYEPFQAISKPKPPDGFPA